jgi:hypothetical protein
MTLERVAELFEQEELKRQQAQENLAPEAAIEETAPGELKPSIEILAAATKAGNPWPSATQELFTALRPGKILGLFRQFRLRTQLYIRDQNLGIAGKLPDLEQLLRQQQPHNGRLLHPELPPARLVQSLRCQFGLFLSEFDDLAICRRLEHIYQVQAQPSSVRTRMGRYYAVTFMPAEGQFRVENVSKAGREIPMAILPLEDLRTLVLLTRSHQLKCGRVIEMFDVRSFKTELDAASGMVRVGGENDEGYSRCCLAKYFNYTPMQDNDGRLLEPTDGSIIAAALALHRGIERVILRGATSVPYPDFPSIYLGFDAEDSIDFEVTPSLEENAYYAVLDWFRSGKRIPNWLGLNRYPTLQRQLCNKLRYAGRSWPDVARQLGDEDARLLLMQVWLGSELSYNGLHLMPLEFFKGYSEQKPVEKAKAVFAQLAIRQLGRDELEVKQEVLQDASGTELRKVQVVPRLDKTMAKVQVMRRSWGAAPKDVEGPYDFDFTTVPTGLEQEFREVTRGDL